VTFTRRYLDPAWFIEYKAFCIFEDKLCTWDHGPINTEGQVLHTADGVVWSKLFSRPVAEIGASGDQDGKSMTVYNGNLFITKYTSPRVIEWNGANVILHLEGSLSPQPDNYMASNLVVWDGKLWCLLDVTSGPGDDKRVVYYYDGSSWTAIADYDGAAYLGYNRGSYLPEYDIKHRTTRLFVFNDELYLIATRYTGTRWAWEVWKFDRAAYNNFTKLYDSDILNDGFVLGAIIEFEGRAYVVGNLLLANGNAGVIGKIYSSSDMVNWTEESEFPLFEDEFDDASRNTRWTDEPNNGTINEAGGVLTLGVAGGTSGNWWQPNVRDAPFVYMTPGNSNITVVTKLNDYTVNTETNAGLMIGNNLTIPDAAGGYCLSFVRTRDGINGFIVADVGSGTLASTTNTTLPMWLRMVISGSGVGSTITFDYSTDGLNWTTLYVASDLTWNFVGLHAKNWGADNVISAPFEFFHVYNVLGFPYGEVLHEGKFYLNCVNADPHNEYTWLRRWEGRLKEFTLDQEITTNPLTHGGGLAVFNGDIYAGKYMEVYGEPRTVLSRTRLKRHSLPLMDIGYKDMHGNKYTERLAPIDTRAPTRFYHGRIKQMSSLKRAIDDKTGLFQVADMSITLANADKHYSQLLASHILKNQEATLYHAWTEEAEVLRLEVIKLIVEDHSMKGPDFTIKLKDITQKYFTMKVPENICTKDNFPFIHPDHEGRCMPEILGNASLVGDYEYEGAVEAVYVNPTGPTFWCLASAGIITIPTDEVWIGTTQKDEGTEYNVVYQPDVLTGVIHTYIQFLDGHDPGDETVSFNAHGYSLAAWNSTNGYIQNLAYIIQYYLRYIMGIPASLINSASFATLAGYYVDMGVHLDSYLIIQDRVDAMEILRQLLFTGGAKGFMVLDGRFNVARKNIYNWQVPEVERHIFEQIELFGSPHRKWNLTSAINTVNVQFGYIPWQNLYTGAKSEYKDNRFERPMEDRIKDRERPERRRR